MQSRQSDLPLVPKSLLLVIKFVYKSPQTEMNRNRRNGPQQWRPSPNQPKRHFSSQHKPTHYTVSEKYVWIDWSRICRTIRCTTHHLKASHRAIRISSNNPYGRRGQALRCQRVSRRFWTSPQSRSIHRPLFRTMRCQRVRCRLWTSPRSLNVHRQLFRTTRCQRVRCRQWTSPPCRNILFRAFQTTRCLEETHRWWTSPHCRSVHNRPFQATRYWVRRRLQVSVRFGSIFRQLRPTVRWSWIRHFCRRCQICSPSSVSPVIRRTVI